MHDDAEHIERIFNIEAMKGELAELSDGKMQMGMIEDIPPEVEEQFLEQVLAFERAPQVTHKDLLARDGVELPPPDELDDDQLALKLIEVIQKLADRQTYLYGTNHLSDRALYAALWAEVLNEETPDLPPDHPMNCHIDLMQHGEEGDDVWMKYYADEETRADIAAKYPDTAIPPHEDPPYDRDRHLPQPPLPKNPFDDPEVAADFWTKCRTILERLLDEEGFRYAPLSEEPEGWAPPEACIWIICRADEPDTLAWWGISGDVPTAVINAEGMPHLRDFLHYISARWQQDADRLAANDPPDELRAIPESDRSRAAHSLRWRAETLQRWATDDASWEEE